MTNMLKWLNVLSFVYPLFLRPLIVKAVNDPDEEWDDRLLEIMDRMFNYTPES